MKKTALFTNKIIRATAAFFAFFLVCAPAFCDYNFYSIPDSAEIRRSLESNWFTCPVSELMGKSSEIHVNSVGQQFQVRYDETLEEGRIIVAPETFMDVAFVDGSRRETRKISAFNPGSQGAWILYRNKQSGKPVKIQFMFNADSDVYLEFTYDSVKTYASVMAYGNYVVKGIPMGIPFDRLYSSSFQQIYNLTSRTLPWNKVLVTTGIYHSSLQMIHIIRENLEKIDYAEDACYNEKGQLYSIINNKPFEVDGEVVELTDEDDRLLLSGAGFTKWIIDGIVEPFTTKRTDISSITNPTLSFNPVGKNGVLEQSYNLTFALDWCRNLAVHALNSRSSRNYSWQESGVDVNLNHFASDSTRYVSETGYSVDCLKSLMYIQAVTEPGWFYLGAIKQFSPLKHDEFAFNNCAVFFPYFDDTGRFDCVVFEMGKEMKLDDFMQRYAGSFVHLERVKASDDFYPR